MAQILPDAQLPVTKSLLIKFKFSLYAFAEIFK